MKISWIIYLVSSVLESRPSPIISYQFFTGTCDAIMVECLPCLSSTIGVYPDDLISRFKSASLRRFYYPYIPNTNIVRSFTFDAT